MPASTSVQSHIVVEETWQKVAAGCRESRNLVIERNMPLVHYVVGRMNLGSSSPMDYDDLVSFGHIGLIDAVERFDHTRGTTFSTYAVRRIRGAIMDELRAMDWAPRSVRSKQRRIDRAVSEIRHQHSREPEVEEVARVAGMTVDEVHAVLEDVRVSHTDSLDYRLEDGTSVQEIVDGGSDDPEEHGIMLEHRQRLAAGMAALGDQAKTFFALYYFENLSFKEIGRLLGVTESRVCQVHTSAVRELRAAL